MGETAKPTHIAVNCLTCRNQALRKNKEPCRSCRMNLEYKTSYRVKRGKKKDGRCETCTRADDKKNKGKCRKCRLNPNFGVNWVSKDPSLIPVIREP